MSEGKWLRGILEKVLSRDLYHLPYKYVVAAAGLVANEDDPSCWFVDNNGSARNLDMPAPSANIDGKRWLVHNISGTAVSTTVRNNGGATIVVIAQGKAAEFMVYNKAGTLTWVVSNTLA